MKDGSSRKNEGWRKKDRMGRRRMEEKWKTEKEGWKMDERRMRGGLIKDGKGCKEGDIKI